MPDHKNTFLTLNILEMSLQIQMGDKLEETPTSVLVCTHKAIITASVLLAKSMELF